MRLNLTSHQGDMPGQQFATALSNAIGTNLAVQGINYSAGLGGNFNDGGCPPAEAAAMTALLTQAATNCPNAKLVVAGYSQGAAMVHRSIEAAPASTVAKIAAAVTFGDTRTYFHELLFTCLGIVWDVHPIGTDVAIKRHYCLP